MAEQQQAKPAAKKQTKKERVQAAPATKKPASKSKGKGGKAAKTLKDHHKVKGESGMPNTSAFNSCNLANVNRLGSAEAPAVRLGRFFTARCRCSSSV